MRHNCRAPRRRPPSAALLFLVALPVLGCGDNSGVGPTLPVAGKVTLNGRPLTTATTIVLFKPDPSRGNNSPFEPTATVDGDGNYRLATRGKKGAPPGWYKVVVTATEGRADADASPKQHRPARSLLAPRYGQAATTPLVVEVVEDPSPDAYDLKLFADGPPGK
jgi:hypothetical protein